MKRFYDRSSLIQPVVRICLCLIRSFISQIILSLGRDVAPNLPEVRALAFVDIDACLYRILEDTLAYLAEKGATLDPATEETFLYYKNLNQQEVKKCIELAEDQHYIRRELTKRRLIAFVANGSILPRESGVSQKPMKGAIAFEAPELSLIHI